MSKNELRSSGERRRRVLRMARVNCNQFCEWRVRTVIEFEINEKCLKKSYDKFLRGMCCCDRFLVVPKSPAHGGNTNGQSEDTGSSGSAAGGHEVHLRRQAGRDSGPDNGACAAALFDRSQTLRLVSGDDRRAVSLPHGDADEKDFAGAGVRQD